MITKKNATRDAAATKIDETQSILIDVLHLADLIETAADFIAETCADDRERTLKAFRHGASIRTASEVIIETIEAASDILMKTQATGCGALSSAR